MSGLETLGIALAGGSVGAILTRMFGVPTAIKDHNREAREIDERLGQWVSDECVRLERELERHKNESASKGHLTAGAYVTGIAHIKEQFRIAPTRSGRQRKRSPHSATPRVRCIEYGDWSRSEVGYPSPDHR